MFGWAAITLDAAQEKAKAIAKKIGKGFIKVLLRKRKVVTARDYLA